ncbi:MAG: site-specific integrase [Alicyclobacillus sp.]|nr:site-specific integrase [Alicyclobacillus sp.]
MRGSVVKRGHKWAIVFDVGRDENGKRKQKWISGFASKKEAEAELAKQISQVTSGQYVPPTDQTVADFLADWARDKQAKVKPTTWRTYSSKIEYHILPHLGKMKLRDVRPQHIASLYQRVREQGRIDGRGDRLSEQTILHIHRILHNVFARAVHWGVLAQNPCVAVERPKPRPKQLAVWTLEQVRKFLDTAKEDPMYPAFLILLTTGMRYGEVFGLRWRDVNLDKQLFTIQQQIVYVKGGYRFQDVKTRAANRRIPVPQEVVAVLREVRKKQLQQRLMLGDKYRHDLDLVCCTTWGTPYYHGPVTRKWNQLIERAELPRIRIHDARHTHASILLQQGVNPKVVQERLGHEDISVTLNTYSHLLPGVQEKVIDEFAQQLFQCRA